MINQIVLITDDRPDESTGIGAGSLSVAASAAARAEGIRVSVVRIAEDGVPGGRAAAEAARIASAGGGEWMAVPARHLPGAVGMIVKRTVKAAVRDAVCEELQHMLSAKRAGPSTGDPIGSLPAAYRGRVAAVIDEAAQAAPLRVLLLVNTAADMKANLGWVQEAVHELLLGLRTRTGCGAVSAFRYPGPGACVERLTGWTNRLAKTIDLFYNLDMELAPPAPPGPAILESVRYFAADVPASGPDHAGRGRSGAGE